MSQRDYAMARLAVASTLLRDLREDVDSVIELFIDPSEDGDGATRAEVLEQTELGVHTVMVAIQAAQAAIAEMSDEELAAEEEDSDDDQDDDDDGEEDPAPA